MIVFCTTCKGRTQHLEITLPKNMEDNRHYKNCKFLVLDYSSPDHFRKFIESKHSADLESGRLVVYGFKCPWPFRMAHAKNMAHRLGIIEGGDILVNLDADNLTGPGFARYVGEQFMEDPNILLWARWNIPNSGRKHIDKGCSGRIAVMKNAFLKAGGYDEVKFPTWGPDDKDFHYRLVRLGYRPVEIDHKYLRALLHNDKMRFREYPHAKPVAGGDPYPPGVIGENPIANFGQFGEGVVFKNFNPVPIKLRPVPTRIFGIGMHKTATTSLHKALTILGYDSAHWKSVRWAKHIWEEMKTLGTSPTLDRSYALSDLPITNLYKELDAAYPGSKYILTARDEAKWLKSIHVHWGRSNQYRDTWTREDSFTHQIHEALYGQSTFDPAVFLARYRRHNYEVQQYFRNRPDDLLTMSMDDGAGWEELCGFLGDKPPVPYPREFVAAAAPPEYQI